MINWLVQSSAAHPDLHRGIAPAELLNPVEYTQLERLPIDKRRHDWLLGRWTAKHLLQSYIEQQTGIQPPLHTITITNNEYGVPFITLNCNGNCNALPDSISNALWNESTLRLSISHCHNHAFCALYVAHQEPGIDQYNNAIVQIGADMEWVEPRAWQFVEEYFTEDEINQVRRAPHGVQDLLVTLIWSGKEAILKALQLGLTVDTRWVTCGIGATERLTSAWNTFEVRWDPRLVYEQAQKRANNTPFVYEWQRASIAITGWWRTMDNYVLTLAIARGKM